MVILPMFKKKKKKKHALIIICEKKAACLERISVKTLCNHGENKYFEISINGKINHQRNTNILKVILLPCPFLNPIKILVNNSF